MAHGRSTLGTTQRNPDVSGTGVDIAGSGRRIGHAIKTGIERESDAETETATESGIVIVTGIEAIALTEIGTAKPPGTENVVNAAIAMTRREAHSRSRLVPQASVAPLPRC
jgi:hypothetical protein